MGSAMTIINERLQRLMRQLPYANKTAGGVKGFEELLRLALLETARDQRHACAEAVLAVEGDNNNPWMIDRDAAHSAAMNARTSTNNQTGTGMVGELWR